LQKNRYGKEVVDIVASYGKKELLYSSIQSVETDSLSKSLEISFDMN
jgi:hypothetical protein